ncbi:MAG: SDR family NAD(P)-dependent oxidoreductase [Deltaproteobacteria bacterium]|nr:SDR family NAD(P)-dependent oxidoreductase [Deltaproteobacteria bacterium]MBI3387767.1 SDR family NAD(P)-dependent oxidoreductase [Deltaproteobacteria bacterium]
MTALGRSLDSSGAIQKVVLITGASSGIGKVCAEHLSARGYHVFGAQRRVPAAGDHRAVEMIAMDVDDDRSVELGVRGIVEKAGHIDAVINCAGNAWMGAIEDTSIAEAKAQLETNFFGVLRVCRAVLPAMRRQGGGHIVNISSLAGVLGLPFSGLYSASKFALEGMSESLRLETRRHGVKVVLIEPGDFRSQLAVTRRTVNGTESNDTYRAAFEKFKLTQEKDEAGAPTPEPVALLVEQILRNPSPKLRYSVGMLGQRIVVPLKRLLPQALFEWVLCRALAL